MAVIGFNLQKILIEKKVPVRGELNVKTSMNIKDIQKQKASVVTGKDTLSFDFDFFIRYFPGSDSKKEAAEICFEGTVLHVADSKETKTILEDWKNKKINPQLRIRILNTILSKCNTKALVLEEDVGLPPHIPMPKFESRQVKQAPIKTEKK